MCGPRKLCHSTITTTTTMTVLGYSFGRLVFVCIRSAIVLFGYNNDVSNIHDRILVLYAIGMESRHSPQRWGHLLPHTDLLSVHSILVTWTTSSCSPCHYHPKQLVYQWEGIPLTYAEMPSSSLHRSDLRSTESSSMGAFAVCCFQLQHLQVLPLPLFRPISNLNRPKRCYCPPRLPILELPLLDWASKTNRAYHQHRTMIPLPACRTHQSLQEQSIPITTTPSRVFFR